MKAAPRDMLCYYAGHNFRTGMATTSASVGYPRGLSEPWDTIVLKLLYIHSVPTFSYFNLSFTSVAGCYMTVNKVLLIGFNLVSSMGNKQKGWFP